METNTCYSHDAITARHLIPTLLVVLLSLLGAWLDRDDSSACPAGPDGPQYACWLEEHPEQLQTTP